MKTPIALCIIFSTALLGFTSVVVTVAPPLQMEINHLDIHFVEICDITNPYVAPQVGRLGVVTATTCAADTIFFGGFE
jgi:hypothetical protein